MKKTLVALLAASSFALGSTEILNVTDVTSATTTFSFADNTSKDVTIALTLNPAAYANIGDNTNIFKLTGTWEDGNAGTIGISSIVGGSNPVKDGIQGAWDYGNNNKNKTSDIKQYTCFADVDWSTVTAMTMVMTYQEGPANNAANLTDDGQMLFNTSISLATTDGEIITLTQEKNDLYRFSVKEGNTVTSIVNDFVATGLSINSTYVESFTVTSGYLTAEQSAALSAARLIPEPTTATLSLLALAGLAARRRRK